MPAGRTEIALPTGEEDSAHEVQLIGDGFSLYIDLWETPSRAPSRTRKSTSGARATPQTPKTSELRRPLRRLPPADHGGRRHRELHRTRRIHRYCHVADVPGRHEPCTSELNYWNVFDAIDDTGYHGYVGLEYSPAADSDPG